MNGDRRPAVKICGVTCPEDARVAVELGAALVGLNFWPRSPRVVDRGAAREIVAAVDGVARVVGVVVDQPDADLEAVLELGCDLVQLHGDESSERVARWGARALKVFRIRDAFEPAELERFASVWGYLFDVRHPAYGGTGESWPYHLVRGLPTSRPVFVAGGVRPETVHEVVAACDPDGLDVCSGVESAPGIKDHAKLEALFEEIRG